MADFSAWEAYKPITVQDANVDGNLTDFPCLVVLDADADVGGRSQSAGQDLRFTLSDGTTQLKHEIENFAIDGTPEASGNIWVKVPSIAASGGALIRMYYGNDAVGDGQDVVNVWDSGFQGIFHMTDATTSSIDDSTVRGATLTKTSANNPTEAAGKIHKSQDFDGSNDSCDSNVSAVGSGRFLLNATGVMSCWMKAQGTAPTISNAYSADTIIGQASAGRFVAISRGIIGGLDRIWMYNWDGNEDRVPIAYTTNTWHHIVWRHVGGTLYAYKDGVFIASTASGNTTSNNDDLWVGAASTSAQLFEGEIDEVRLSNVDRSADWIKFEHANINEADNELTIGAEVVAAVDIPHYYYAQEQAAAL